MTLAYANLVRFKIQKAVAYFNINHPGSQGYNNTQWCGSNSPAVNEGPYSTRLYVARLTIAILGYFEKNIPLRWNVSIGRTLRYLLTERTCYTC